ncbi:MAG: hypothetical protein ACTSSK_06940 [Candidatus Heimdallarchaeota archaeon]
MIPKFMLKKLYVENSLKQDGNKITFQMLNTKHIKIDELEFDLAKIEVTFNDEKIVVAEISEEKPFSLTKGVTFTFHIEGCIQPGKHKIDLNFLTKEAF